MSRRSAGNKSDSFAELSAITSRIADWLTHSPQESVPNRFARRIAGQLPATTNLVSSADGMVDLMAQLFVLGRWAWLQAGPELHKIARHRDIFPPRSTLMGDVLRWIAHCSAEFGPSNPELIFLESQLAEIDHLATRDRGPNEFGVAASQSLDFDIWLSHHDRKRRATFGVYYTPRPIATHIVQQVDDLLRSEFQLADGLADVSPWNQMEIPRELDTDPIATFARFPFINVLDPALGTGVFLVEVIDVVYQTLQRKWEAAGIDDAERAMGWNLYVSHYLLSRLKGIEILLIPAIIAWIRLAAKLCQTGYIFRGSSRINVAIGDTLALAGENCGDNSAMTTRPKFGDAPFTVIVGNPPFSALATNNSTWIYALLRNSEMEGREVGSYYEVDGQPLGERKLWLHDDYVKFLRHAQWCIERAGCGIVGFVTNHGYLDNLTFRGMRQSLLKSFPRVTIVDLHGNRKKHESSPDGSRDENVFGIEQGVAIGLFRKPPSEWEPSVTHTELWGTRDDKCERLTSLQLATTAARISPARPYYFLSPPRESTRHAAEYQRGFPLNEVMPVNSTAAVTARDSFVVAFTQEELIERVKAFCDPEVSNDEIRQRFFQTTRSRRYATGDTRGWKLDLAREFARADGDPARHIRSCQYRPFDRRFLLWADWLVDWPRHQVMRHMLAGDNLALVARRQMLPTQPCNFFWITDSIVVDGLIRSDNRGSESFFPLYLRRETPDGNGQPILDRSVNFAEPFLVRCQETWHWKLLGWGRGNLESSVGPEDILAMVYAQCFSNSYRERYAEWLRLGFPRVFIPQQQALAIALCQLGHQLVDCHTLRRSNHNSSATGQDRSPGSPIPDQVTTDLERGRYPYFEQGSIVVSDSLRLPDVTPAMWEYRVGGHQVCRKWLRDRRDRCLTRDELATYGRMVASIGRTIDLSSEIDRVIEHHGGWASAFVGQLDSVIQA